ncbi:MAG TPA: hypothetical protein VJ725_21445 [Thermoanaerobaculia bacterium]|nr:hypothetical protein [Thermoanaerobaculia bacterium]
MKRTDIDLTGAAAFRFDLKTVTVLLMLAFTWWDGRAQEEKRAAVQDVQNRTTSDALAELKRLTTAQQYSIEAIRVTMAENGIKIKQ